MDMIECPCGNKYPEKQHDGGYCHSCGRVLGKNKDSDRAKAIKIQQEDLQTPVIVEIAENPSSKDMEAVVAELSNIRFSDSIVMERDIEPVYSLGSSSPVGYTERPIRRSQAEMERDIYKKKRQGKIAEMKEGMRNAPIIKETERTVMEESSGKFGATKIGSIRTKNCPFCKKEISADSYCMECLEIPIYDSVIPGPNDRACQRCASKMLDNYCPICHIEDYDETIFDPPLFSTVCQVCGSKLKGDFCPNCGPIVEIGPAPQERCGACGTVYKEYGVCKVCKPEPQLTYHTDEI